MFPKQKGETKYDLTCSWCGFHYPPKSFWFIIINWIASSQNFLWSALRKTNIAPNKKVGCKTIFLLGRPMLRGYVGGRVMRLDTAFWMQGAPNLLFQHTQWLERHEITIHPVRSAHISPTQMIFRVKFIKHLLVPGLEVFLMFFCLISRCSTFLQPGFPTFLLAEFLPVTVSWWSDNLGGFFPSPSQGIPCAGCAKSFPGKAWRISPISQHQDESPTHQCPRGFPHQLPFNQSGRLKVGPVLCQDFGWMRDFCQFTQLFICNRMALETCWIHVGLFNFSYFSSSFRSRNSLHCFQPQNSETRNSPSFLHLLHLRCGH